MILNWYQATGNLGKSFRWQHRFSSFSCVASPDTANVKCGADAGAFGGGITSFTHNFFDPNGFLVLFKIKWSLREQRTFFSPNFNYIVVESGNSNAPFFIHHLGDHFSQHGDWVGHGAAKQSRVQITVGPRHFYLPVGQSTQPCCNGGYIGSNHGGI